MVGKSRNTIKGTTRSIAGNAGGGGTVDTGNQDDRVALQTGNIIEDALCAQPEGTLHYGRESLAEIITTTPIGDVMPDLSGRGTPGERIAPRILDVPGMGAGTGGNLGVHHGRNPGGGGIPGGGASFKTVSKPVGEKPGKKP